MSEPRSARFCGRSPSDRDDEWTVATVARRATNKSGATPCAVTNATVTLSEPHYYVTLKREDTGSVQPTEYEHLVVAEDALDELDAWLENNDER